MPSHLMTEFSSHFLRHCEEWTSEIISQSEKPTVVREDPRMEIHDSPQIFGDLQVPQKEDMSM